MSNIIVTFANAETLAMSRTAYYNYRSEFQRRVQPRFFLHVGHYEVCIGARDLSVSVDDEVQERAGDHAWDRVWGSERLRVKYAKQRLCTQFPILEGALAQFPQHPYAQRLRKALQWERTGWTLAFRRAPKAVRVQLGVRA